MEIKIEQVHMPISGQKWTFGQQHPCIYRTITPLYIPDNKTLVIYKVWLKLKLVYLYLGKSCENGRGYFFIVKIWKSVLELHMQPIWKCFGIVIMKSYENTLNFEYGTSKFDFTHLQCPMVTHLKFGVFHNYFNIWFILSQLFVFISCYWPHVSNKTLCKCLD